MIIAEVCKQWPEEEETPWFGKNSTEGGKLMSFIDRLANDERFTFPKYGLGRNAIKDMTLTHMRERRRAQKDATLLGSTSGESTVSPSSAEDSSSGSTPPPSLFDKKRKEYVSYFNPGKCCHERVTKTCSVLMCYSWLRLNIIICTNENFFLTF